MSLSPSRRLAIIGGGPAGLMAAGAARAAGVEVDVYEGKGSVGRKFLLAGKGGLNLTHSEEFSSFIRRYGARCEEVHRWLSLFGPQAVRDWARELGVETFVGSSGRVFPSDLKAAPLLRRWVRRLRDQGVRFHVHHYCIGIDMDTSVRFETPAGLRIIDANSVVLAMGGASWPELGSDGRWTEWLESRGVQIAPLRAANCGFDVGWSDIFAQRFAGAPVKTVRISTADEHGGSRSLQGEFVITSTGVEGSAIYALSSTLRDAIDSNGSIEIRLDLTPQRELDYLHDKLSGPRGARSLTEHLRRQIGLAGVKVGLLFETTPKEALHDPARLAAAIKSTTLKLVRARPVSEAISSAGGIRFDALDDQLMIKALPGVFCAGEMIDWEAPTGGYLLTACFASGRVAGLGAATFLNNSQPAHGR
ncbi:MAG: TIGR03862 family flavoprotein [Steroidobacter sp.]